VYVYGGEQGNRGGTFLRPELKVTAQSTTGNAVLFDTASLRSAITQYVPDGTTIYQHVAIASGTDNEVTADSGADFSTKMDETDIASMNQIGGHTHETYEVNDVITLQNHAANAIGFGAEVAARVWGQMPKKVTQTDDYGFVQGLGFEAVYGQKILEDYAANAPNHVVMKHYCKAPFII